MTIVQSIILGIIQGLTEFIPVSSSGHLVLVPHLFGWQISPEESFIFNILLQVATLVAVFAYFWLDILSIVRTTIQDIRQKQPLAHPESRLAWLLAVATIPAGLAGLFLNGTLEKTFDSPLATSIFLLGTAVLLVSAEKFGKRSRPLSNIRWLDAIWIGITQILALLPGISRSGATITGGMLRDLDRPAAARFSFLMSIPIMIAAGLFASLKLTRIPNFIELLPTFSAGFIAAAVTGYLAIRWLLKYLSSRSLYVFAIYCAAFGVLNIIIIAVRGQ
ncbi:MAG: undecaprenyl-diphosphatase UppP [Anaerolineales bacterium]|jgi:undecaprenyl-diphosphatase